MSTTVINFEIRDEHGTHVATHRRTEGIDGKKTGGMLWFQPDGSPGLGGTPAEELPLFGSECLGELEPGHRVIVCEGEKAADTLKNAGLLALGTVTGAQSTPCDEVLRTLRGLDVLLWPDADEAGHEHMRRIALRLVDLGIPCRLVEWHDAPAKADAFEALAALGLAGMRSLVDEAAAYTPSKWAPLDTDGWRPAVPFPMWALPSRARPWVEETAARLCVDPAMPGTAALGALSVLVAPAMEIALDDKDWHVRPNLYTVSWAESGSCKSDALKAFSGPIRDFECMLIDRSSAKRAECAGRVEGLRRRRDAAAKASGDDAEEQLALATRDLEAAEAGLYEPRAVLGDVTPEKLGEMLAEHDECLLMTTDEPGFFGTLAGRYSPAQAANMDVFLQAHDGSPSDCDRLSRKSVRLKNPLLSVAITGQPSVLADILAHPAMTGRGIVQRFLQACPAEVSNMPSRAVRRARRGDSSAEPAYEALVADLGRMYAGFRPRQAGRDGDPPSPQRYQVTAEAGEAFDDFAEDCDSIQRESDGALRGWLSKLPAQVGRIAGLLHACDSAGTPFGTTIEETVMRRAVALGRYYLDQARRIFDPREVLTPEGRKIVSTARRINDRNPEKTVYLPSEITGQMPNSRKWDRVRSKKGLMAEVRRMEERGLAIVHPNDSFEFHPEILAAALLA